MNEELEELKALVARNCTARLTGYLHISKGLFDQLVEGIEGRREPETAALECRCHPDFVGESLDNCPKCSAEYEAAERAAAEANPHL